MLGRYFIYTLIFAASLLWAQVIDAATYYVAKTGNNSNSCTSAQNPSTPKLTIAAGRGCLSSGDTLVIKAGTYVERISNIPSGSSDTNRTVIKAEEPRTVTVKPTGSGHAVTIPDGASYITLQGLVLNGADMTGQLIKVEGNGADGTAHHISLIDAEVNDANASCVNFSGHSHRVSNVRFLRCGIGSGSSLGGHGLYWQSKNSTIENVSVNGWTGYGIQLYSKDRNPSGNIVKNSIFYGGRSTVAGSGAGGITVYGTDNKIYNNVAYDNDGDGVAIHRNNTTVRNNIVFGNRQSAIHVEAGKTGIILSNNLTTNPQFVNAPGGDFHLKNTSPAINQGTNLAVVGITTDKDGNPRPEPSGTLYDIGPYECQNPAAALCEGIAPQPNPDILVVHYTGDNTFADSSGNGFHLTANGGMVATGAPIIGSNDFLLDGVNDYASLSPLSSLLKPTDGICISAWVKTSSATATIVGVGGGSSLSLQDGQGRFATQFAATHLTVMTTSTAVANNVVHHLVGTYDQASGLRIYLDGAQQGFQSATEALVYPVDLLTIGRRAVVADQFLAGIIGQIKIFNFPCTPEAVVSLFNEQTPSASISSTHLAWINPITGNILGLIDASRSHRINERLGVRSSIANSSTDITEFFPLVVCDVANCESDVDWIEVTGTVNALGLVLETDPVFVMGDSTNALFNLAGFTFTQGRYVIPTVNETVKTGLGPGVVTEWEYRRIRFTSPAVPGKQYKFRLLRENRSPFPNYASTPVLTLIPSVKGTVSSGCDDSGIMNR